MQEIPQYDMSQVFGRNIFAFITGIGLAFRGHIRFHVTSFDDGHVFARKLDWMIEATLHEAER